MIKSEYKRQGGSVAKFTAMVKLQVSLLLGVALDVIGILLVTLSDGEAVAVAFPAAEIVLNGSDYYSHGSESQNSFVIATVNNQSARKSRDYSQVQTQYNLSHDNSKLQPALISKGAEQESGNDSVSVYQLARPSGSVVAEMNRSPFSVSEPPQGIIPPSSIFLPVGSSEDLENRTASVRGIRVEDAKKGVSYENKGVSVILADSGALVRLFGERFTRHTIIRFVTEMGARGSDCDDLTSTKSFPVSRQMSELMGIKFPKL